MRQLFFRFCIAPTRFSFIRVPRRAGEGLANFIKMRRTRNVLSPLDLASRREIRACTDRRVSSQLSVKNKRGCVRRAVSGQRTDTELDSN